MWYNHYFSFIRGNLKCGGTIALYTMTHNFCDFFPCWPVYVSCVFGRSNGWKSWSMLSCPSCLNVEFDWYQVQYWFWLISNSTFMIKNTKPIPNCQFSCSIMSNSLQSHGLQHTRLSCPSTTPWACSSSCPLSRWCHPAISSSAIPFSSCPQSFPASGSFPMSQFFASGGQSIGLSASTSVLPMNSQDWSPLGWTGWISLQSKGLSRVFCNTTVQKHQFFSTQLSFYSNSHIHTWLHPYKP